MGLIENKIYYTYNDITIVPAVISDINHRFECDAFDGNGMLPLFTAPMDTVVSEKNFDLFEQNHINAILPRTEPLSVRVTYSMNGKWAAYSLNEFSHVFCNEGYKLPTTHKLKALIDLANGHMQSIFDIADKAKGIYGDDLLLMGGNIANPKTYKEYVKHGFWGVRCAIGVGCGCITSSNLGIHCPIASLLAEIHKIKNEMIQNGADKEHLTKIIADGGIRNYSDIIKAVGILGADYVMIGSVFAKMAESAAPKQEIDGETYATFYGMASREGQIAMNGQKTKTSEGVKKLLKVEYTMEGWTRNFIDYLRSAMSYTNCHNIKEFNPDNVDGIIISQEAQKSINK